MKKGISGSTLKIIAILSMLTDHTGAVLLERLLLRRGYLEAVWRGGEFFQEFYRENVLLVSAHFIMRDIIGRWGFPIFCFLLVEGFLHTRSVWKYAGRLGLFALISEVPFDLAFYGTPFYPEYQNVFFTLLLGLAVLIGWRFITEKTARSFWVRLPLYILCFAAFAALADALFTDYGAKGVTAIAALYAFRSVKWRQVLAGSIAFVWELPAPLAFLPVWFYNGQRGLKMKYFFYIFYPAHLYLLYLAARFGGLV